MPALLRVALVLTVGLAGCARPSRRPPPQPDPGPYPEQPREEVEEGPAAESDARTQPRDARAFSDWPEVRSASDQAIQRHLTTADRRFDSGDFHGAIDAYSQALRMDPELAYAYCNRGSARRRLADYRGAILDLTMAIRNRPDYGLAYNNRGYAHLLARQPDLALADFDRALELGDVGYTSFHLSMTYRNRARALRALGRDREAAADERKARILESRRRAR